MASNLRCLGLPIDDVDDWDRLLVSVLPAAVEIGKVGDVVVRRWQDPSGCRLTMSTRGREILDVLPSFAALPGARLSAVAFLSAEVASAAVLDEDGEQVTALTLELEAHRLLQVDGAPTEGTAAITALGVDIEVFGSADEFATSDASYMTPPSDEDAEPPPHFVEHGWDWPPRLGPESFISLGIWGAPEAATAHARLAGTVLDARTHTVSLTGHTFVEARVRTVGFEAHACFPADEHPVPVAGSIVSGTVFLVGSMNLPSTPSRRWPRRRSR